MRVAVDLDSTLANTCRTAYELMGVREYDPSEHVSFDWPLEEFGEARFLNAIWGSWTIRPHEIEPMDENPAEHIERIAEVADVDVVTQHPDHLGIDEAKRGWLDDHGIPYEELVPVRMGESKGDLGYDIIYDDKPTVPERADGTIVVLRDRPYNRHVTAHARVSSTEEAADEILDAAEWVVKNA